jgi:hypothetical protein
MRHPAYLDAGLRAMVRRTTDHVSALIESALTGLGREAPGPLHRALHETLQALEAATALAQEHDACPHCGAPPDKQSPGCPHLTWWGRDLCPACGADHARPQSPLTPGADPDIDF